MSALVELLAAHVALDEKEAIDLGVMRTFAVELEQPFSRTQWPAHFTGSAVVVSPGADLVCLVLHGKLNRWLQPGGHADPADGGSLEATALREAREETGLEVRLHPAAPRPLDVDVHVIPARRDEPEHSHLDVRYLLSCTDAAALQHDATESHGAQWLGWDDALARADEAALRRLLARARTQVGR